MKEVHHRLAGACSFKGAPIRASGQASHAHAQAQQHQHQSLPHHHQQQQQQQRLHSHPPPLHALEPVASSPATANPFTDDSFLGPSQSGLGAGDPPAATAGPLLPLDPHMSWAPAVSQSSMLCSPFQSAHSPAWSACRGHSGYSENRAWQPGQQDLLA